LDDSNEVTRFLRLAREYKRLGDRSRAVRILESMLDLVEGQRKWESEAGVARELLEKWRQESVAGPDDVTLVTAALERAREAQQGGRIEEARRVWQSIIELYAGDTRARDVVAEARRGLAETEDQGR
jgi:cytochrome c-type biogenesis protein CcmH/NrfG